MDFVSLTDREPYSSALRRSELFTTMKELELKDKSQTLRSQRILLERNMHSVSDKQVTLQHKEQKLEAIQHKLVNTHVELQQSLFVLSQQEKVLCKAAEVLTDKLQEARSNKERTQAIKSALTVKLGNAQSLYNQLQVEERELGLRQLQLCKNEKVLASERVSVSEAAESIKPKWVLYQQHQAELEMERRTQGLLHLRETLSERELQLREKIRNFEDSDLQLKVLNQELEREQSALTKYKSEIVKQCTQLESKRLRLELTLSHYEASKTSLSRLQERKPDPIPSTNALELELSELKTANQSTSQAISSIQSEEKSAEHTIRELRRSVVQRETELKSREADLKEKLQTLRKRQEKVAQSEKELAELAEVEACMDGKMQRMVSSEEDWKRAHSSELQAIREYMARIEQKTISHPKPSPSRAIRT